MRAAAALLLGVLAVGCAGAPVAPAAPNRARLADLAWISGCWEGPRGKGRVFERWEPASGGALRGRATLFDGAAMRPLEDMRLEQTRRGVVFTAQPAGEGETEFPLVDFGPGWARFANPGHDFPKTIRYAREGDRLRAWIGDGSSERLALDVMLSGCE